MLGNRLYYHFKPYLPWQVRMALRRMLARRIRRNCQDVWPINEAAAQPPAAWPGWPDGKKFAFVLTHDVEGPDGLAKCRQLMELEKQLGFRSSFNFVPEGDYAVSRELREELAQNGFEVGMHDLHHDGTLYWSRQRFSENAKWINHYLKEWGAVGFRSGFMLHNLEWQHELNVLYDASTFDTDPFEPQPDGVGTIFPFWVANKRPRGDTATRSPDRSELSVVGGQSERGYVELPYTLVQDSTLFLTLRETSPEIWLRKLDWIVQHGGMALVNVHPDYLCFPGEPASPRTFPVEFYLQLLRHVRERFGGAYWQPLPRELAGWYRGKISESDHATGPTAETAPASRRTLRGKRAAVILYAGIVSDARPRRELEALLEEGMSVDLICLQEEDGGPAEEVRGPLRITRISIRHDRNRKTSYFRNYGVFFLRAFAQLTARSLRQKYDLVHIHNMPDALVFAALAPRLRGAKIILDLHDPMPELYQTIYGLNESAWMIRLLKWLERWSIRFAHLVLTPNEAFRRVFCARGCPPAKIQIVMNSPDEDLFNPHPPAKRLAVSPLKPDQGTPDGSFVAERSGLSAILSDDEVFDSTRPAVKSAGGGSIRKFRLMYHGLIVERHGVDLAIQAVNRLTPDFPGMVLDLFGERNVYLDRILQEAQTMGLNGRIRYHGMRRLDDIPSAILQTDLGIIPNLRTPFTEINFPTRIFEYLQMGKPVIVPDTRGIRDYFDDGQILFFKPGDAEDLARTIRWVCEHPAETALILKRGQEVYQRHRWALEKFKFIHSVDSLLHPASVMQLDYEPRPSRGLEV